jgi:hypothetical protein
MAKVMIGVPTFEYVAVLIGAILLLVVVIAIAVAIARAV